MHAVNAKMKDKKFPSVAGIRLGHMRFADDLIAMSTWKYCAQKQLGGIQFTANEDEILISYPMTLIPLLFSSVFSMRLTALGF